MKILIAEDDISINLLMKNLFLRWGYDAVSALDGAEAWRLIQAEEAPSIVLLDWMMPELDGLEVCRRIRELEKKNGRYTYIMMLSARDDKKDVIAGMEAGADDYIVKPFNREELRARLRAGQRLIELQTALRAANSKLLIMSRWDSLTGALSRNAIFEELQLAMYRSTREKTPLGLVLLDFDDLKAINERFGRDAGDRMLQNSVRSISARIRRTDGFGRLGSDEFLVIVPGVGIDTGVKVCRRIQEIIAGETVAVGGEALRVTTSQSFVLWDGKAGSDALITALNKVLEKTKGDGGNRLKTLSSGDYSGGE